MIGRRQIPFLGFDDVGLELHQGSRQLRPSEIGEKIVSWHVCQPIVIRVSKANAQAVSRLSIAYLVGGGTVFILGAVSTNPDVDIMLEGITVVLFVGLHD